MNIELVFTIAFGVLLAFFVKHLFLVLIGVSQLVPGRNTTGSYCYESGGGNSRLNGSASGGRFPKPETLE